jgi:ketosteroid isomerase-like protein
MSVNTDAVAAVLAKYNAALNASDTQAVMPLYHDDGVFMPPYRRRKGTNDENQISLASREKCFLLTFPLIEPGFVSASP